MRNIYSSKLNKKGQFFILSAVIIASIIVSLASVKNFVSTGDAPKKFYYYSQQLEGEAGAVVDYALYNDPTGDNNTIKQNLNSFLQRSIDKTLEGYPDMEIFSCYTNATAVDNYWLTCQNNGMNIVNITAEGWNNPSVRTLYGSKYVSSWVCPAGTPELVCTNLRKALITSSSFSIVGLNYINATSFSNVYRIDLNNAGTQRGQFYFLLKMNTSSGTYVTDSTGTKPIS